MTTRPMMPSSRQAGFSLIEALTALLVTAVGMLAIAGLHVTLSQNSDIAKQRSEAVRLAQLKMEELRAFQQIATDPTTGVGHKFNYTDDVVTGEDTVSPTTGYSNALFKRIWTVTGSGTDLQKWVRVVVYWTDRTNAPHIPSTQATCVPVIPYNNCVSLQSVIARSDPISIGTLATGQEPNAPRTPKNRNINIPYPAVGITVNYTKDNENYKVAGAAFLPPGSTVSYVFDNVSGNVLGNCTTQPAAGIEITLGSNGTRSGANGCTLSEALLLSGYIRFVSGGYNQNQVDTAFGNPKGDTLALSAAINFISPTSAASADCYTERQKVVSVGNIATRTITRAERPVVGFVEITTSSNHGFSVGQPVSINDVDSAFNGVFMITSRTNTTFRYAQPGTAITAPITLGTAILPTATLVQQVAVRDVAGTSETPDPTPPGYNTEMSKFVAYTCVVVPVEPTGAPAGSTKRWSGQFYITPNATAGAWTLGATSAHKKVCRYTGDYKVGGGLSNSEHPLYYRGVTGALDHQNYVVIDGNEPCPYDGPSNAATGDYINSNTTRHQTTATEGVASHFGGLFSGSNNGGASRNGGIEVEESANLATELPMF